VLSPRAAGLFGLEVLADRIETDPANRTRFVVVGRPEPAAPGPVEARSPAHERPMRTTLALAVRNEPGALLRVLRVFSDAGLNMSTLESRPSRDVAWEYVFWIDLDAAVDAPPAVAALAALGSVTQFLRVLGSYPRAVGA
jgi:prephenate dehydratase